MAVFADVFEPDRHPFRDAGFLHGHAIEHVSAGHAAHSAATAVQVLASAGSQDGHVVARAYRDAKLMEIIEGSNEICQLILAEHALSQAR